jgi:hypothetical protein
MNIREAIEKVKQELAKPDYDAQLAVLWLRDYQEVTDAQLDDLAWALYQDGCAHKNDVIGLIEHLESYLATQPDWEAIKRCPIWKVLGVIECNTCNSVEQCWGTDINLDKLKGI